MPTAAEGIEVAPIEYLLSPGDLHAGMVADVRMGLTSTAKSIPPKYFYDDRGSELFDEITRLPEYYPTRAERALLRAHAAEIAQLADAEVLLELGSGSSEKTRWLLAAMAEHGGLKEYVPVDVSDGALRSAAENLRGLPILMRPIVADFERHLPDLPIRRKRLVAFLGGTIGNLAPEPRAEFLSGLSSSMAPGEIFLLGCDLVKDQTRLVNAYDDAQGVTADFNLNVLRVLNRELGADFDVDAFTHRALWDPVNEWIEMRLVANESMTVRVPGADVSVAFEAGEELRTEISAKFHRERISAELMTAGLTPIGWWSDGDYAVVLASKE